MRFLKHYWATPLSILLAVTLLTAVSASASVDPGRRSEAVARVAATVHSYSSDVVSPISQDREARAIGAAASKGSCDFAGGVAAGLFIASLFGCPVCGLGSGAIAVGIAVFC